MTKFRLLRVFNDEKLRGYANSDSRVAQNIPPHFSGDTLIDRLVRELAHARAMPIKELVEAFEFFAVVRRYLRRSPVIVDLCCGHGLAGLLFAVMERRTEEVLLCDQRKPNDFDRIWQACLEVAPWIESKVRYVEGPLAETRTLLQPESAVVAVHACGLLTDTCIEVGLELGGPFAVMPCCRAHAQNPAPEGLRQALGEDIAYDVERSYAIERGGCRVRWREIPEAVTPMNRVLIAVPRPTSGSVTTA